jgi:hypothetical protein
MGFPDLGLDPRGSRALHACGGRGLVSGLISFRLRFRVGRPKNGCRAHQAEWRRLERRRNPSTRATLCSCAALCFPRNGQRPAYSNAGGQGADLGTRQEHQSGRTIIRRRASSRLSAENDHAGPTASRKGGHALTVPTGTAREKRPCSRTRGHRCAVARRDHDGGPVHTCAVPASRPGGDLRRLPAFSAGCSPQDMLARPRKKRTAPKMMAPHATTYVPPPSEAAV